MAGDCLLGAKCCCKFTGPAHVPTFDESLHSAGLYMTDVTIQSANNNTKPVEMRMDGSRGMRSLIHTTADGKTHNKR